MKNRLPGSFIAVGNLKSATTGYHKEPLSSLFSICRGAIEFNNRTFLFGDRMIRTNLNWIRDYILTLKGFKYFEKDLTSFPDLLLEKQTPKGFFFEIIAPLTDCHGRGMGCPSECFELFPDKGFGLTRLELEADIEYLMVEGVYLIWQASGDDEYLRKNLPRLEKGIHYIMTDPKRWDETYQLAKRPRTIDTWDFLDRASSGSDRSIHDDDPMGIMHGDNTGLYQAHVLLAKMYHTIGEEKLAAQHEKTSVELRERINRYLWNGEFYKHFLRLDNTDYGVDETWQLSLSNAYALNRGSLDHEQILKVIRRYQSMRETYGGNLDDFRTLDPAYPVFQSFPAGLYLNGTIGPFVAGELALAAFENGMEEYGADILDRIGCKILDDGKIAFLYNLDGSDIAGGPRCWCGAEIMNALSVGLAGVRDNGKLYRDVTISPRWPAASESRAYVRLEYAVSGAFVEYEWRHDAAARMLSFELVSTHDHVTLRLLMPKSAEHPVCSVPCKIEMVEQSCYLVIADPKPEMPIKVQY